MPFSKSVTGTAFKALSLMLKATDVDIRTHDTDLIPDQPVLYVVNHFTRIETLFFPTLIHDITGKFSYSLAFHELFQGNFGKVMNMLGALSTRDPDRDRILISTLLKGDMNAIIFPEGQMIKDKKIVEKGKFLVYNSGMRRPPHTGSARLALLAEFYRKKIAHFLQTGNREGAVAIGRHFNLQTSELEKISQKKTMVVPVNITYYPVRARENAIERFVEKLASGISERFEEELQVEGNMLLDGVDIDINFGKPLEVHQYLEQSGKLTAAMTDTGAYLSTEDRKKYLPLHKPGLVMTNDYMKAIYSMTTVNHDHIISWFIASYPGNMIPMLDLKNRVYLALRDMNRFNLATAHTTLYRNQELLLSDDLHEKFDNLITVAENHGLLALQKDVIKKNPSRFSNVYEFHTIRQNNILEVLKNEIEPLTDLTHHLRKILLISPTLLKKKIIREFLELDQRLYQEAFDRYNGQESKRNFTVGKPFYLKGFFRKKGILLIHGYMAAPEEMRELGDFLYSKGYRVYGVRLDGHGTSPEELATKKWQDWYTSVNRGYIILKNSCSDMAVAGFSTGAGLALLQAARKDEHFKSVISISAPLKLKNIQSRFASVVTFWNSMLERFNVSRGKLDFVENQPENPHINYHQNPISGVYQLELLMKEVESVLKKITIPTLVIQGSDDPVVDPDSALEVFDALGTNARELVRIYSKRHGIVRGSTSRKVGHHVITFLKEHEL